MSSVVYIANPKTNMVTKQDVFPVGEVADVLDKALDKALSDLKGLSEQIERNEWEILRLKVRSVGEVFSAFLTEGVLFVSPRGLILYANERIERTFGYTADELNRQHVEMLIPMELSEPAAEHREDLIAISDRLMVSGMVVGSHGLRKDGSECRLGLTLHQGQIEHGRVFCLICTVLE